MEIGPRISVDKDVRFGKPVITGTRVPVDLVLGKLASGMQYEEVMDVRDVGLRGAKDDAVFAFAQSNEAVLVTGDLGFGNICDFLSEVITELSLLIFQTKLVYMKSTVN